MAPKASLHSRGIRVEIHLLSLFLLAIRSRVAGGWSGCRVRREGEELEQEVSELQRRGERSGSGRRVSESEPSPLARVTTHR
jgi:hypothetical protein